MKFGLQTLMSLVASAALVLTCIRSYETGIALLVFVIPIFLVIIGLTSPQRGHQLDPSKRWYFFVLAKTWVFTCVGLVFMMLLCAASPYLRDRLVRGANGDTRTHQITIFFTGSRVVSDDMYGKRLSLYDSSGFVGEIRNVGCTETIQNGKLINSRIWLRVSTDRQDALDRNRKEYTVDIRPNGLLYIQD